MLPGVIFSRDTGKAHFSLTFTGDTPHPSAKTWPGEASTETPLPERGNGCVFCSFNSPEQELQSSFGVALMGKPRFQRPQALPCPLSLGPHMSGEQEAMVSGVELPSLWVLGFQGEPLCYSQLCRLHGGTRHSEWCLLGCLLCVIH